MRVSFVCSLSLRPEQRSPAETEYQKLQPQQLHIWWITIGKQSTWRTNVKVWFGAGAFYFFCLSTNNEEATSCGLTQNCAMRATQFGQILLSPHVQKWMLGGWRVSGVFWDCGAYLEEKKKKVKWMVAPSHNCLAKDQSESSSVKGSFSLYCHFRRLREMTQTLLLMETASGPAGENRERLSPDTFTKDSLTSYDDTQAHCRHLAFQ